MVLVLVILCAALAAGAVTFWKFWSKLSGQPQRSWLFRVSVFGIGGLVLIGGVIAPLPFKHRLLALVPAFFLMAIFIKVVRSGWARLRSDRGVQQPDLERMKRIN
jgi:hypothetical protein